VVGLIGALVGGLIAGLFIQGSIGFIGSIIVAFLGAVILLALLRLVGGRRTTA
jgi:uncharacterized membrane protein YeaQ/YmgE (transglycosylase-associated protein family)